ncbi:MAG: SGNH/GDSL hydrolase family protein, partial [Candidatus Nomurabacteria bacterium]|nr:SGNH/GDSL hydrolase family protein [Candidatus Nomurabacteria bacterium]
KLSKKPDKLFIALNIFPVVVIITTTALWFIFPAGASNQSSLETFSEKVETVDIQSIINKVNIALNPPEAESQATSLQIAEQKRIEAEKSAAEKKRLEQERLEAIATALKIKQARDEARNKICFIGDSITEGDVYGERGAAERAIDILNAGHPAEDPPYDGINIGRGGSTTAMWAGSIGSDINNCAKTSLRVIMIMLGTNDAIRGVSVEEYLQNMSVIRSAASQLGVQVFVNCPILLGSDKDPSNTSPITPAYCSGLGANGVTWSMEMNLTDGIHPDSSGYQAIASRWADLIRAIVGI